MLPKDQAWSIPPSPCLRKSGHLRYLAGPLLQEGAEFQVQALLERTERELRATGAETTIHALWMTLVDRAMIGDTLGGPPPRWPGWRGG